MTAYDRCIGLYNEAQPAAFRAPAARLWRLPDVLPVLPGGVPRHGDAGDDPDDRRLSTRRCSVPTTSSKALATSAIAHGVDGSFADGRTPEDVLAELGESEEGRAWIADSSRASTRGSSCRRATASTTTIARGPTIYGSRSPRSRGTSRRSRGHRASTAEGAGCSPSATGSRPSTAQLLPSDEERESFEEMLGLCRHVFPHAEGHKFFIEHWGTSLFFNKMREIGAVMAENGFFETPTTSSTSTSTRCTRRSSTSARVVGWHGRARDVTGRRESSGARRFSRRLRVDAAAGARRRARGDQRPHRAAAVGRHRRPAPQLGESERRRGNPRVRRFGGRRRGPRARRLAT